GPGTRSHIGHSLRRGATTSLIAPSAARWSTTRRWRRILRTTPWLELRREGPDHVFSALRRCDYYVLLAEVFAEVAQISIDGSGVTDHEARDESKNRVVDLAILDNT